MKQINSNIQPRIVAVCGKLVVFELDKNEYAWASKRVANDILRGDTLVFYTEGPYLTLPKQVCNIIGGVRDCNVYLATPNIW